jgi:hypothetical protein
VKVTVLEMKVAVKVKVKVKVKMKVKVKVKVIEMKILGKVPADVKGMVEVANRSAAYSGVPGSVERSS